MVLSQPEIIFYVTLYALPAWAIFLLGIALIVGISNKRRPSISVDLFILAVIGAHILQILFYTHLPQFHRYLIFLLGFVPARYFAEFNNQWPPGGWPACFWSPFTYTVLHQNGPHLFGNCMVLFIFGRTVAWRIGGLRFVLLFFLAGAAGALLHLVFYWGSNKPLIGASAGAFGIMGATFRFVPGAKDRLKALFWPDQSLRSLPLSLVGDILNRRRSLVYVLICLTIYPLGLMALLAGSAGNTAVLAHVGGFARGLFGIGYFVRGCPRAQDLPSDEVTAVRESESLGMRILRFIAIAMMVIGLILGVLTYYMQPFRH